MLEGRTVRPIGSDCPHLCYRASDDGYTETLGIIPKIPDMRSNIRTTVMILWEKVWILRTTQPV